MLQTHFGQYQLNLDVAHGYIHGPCTTACILANTAWNLPKKLLGILYHKLSIIMLIRRGAGCFKAYFRIFVNLEKFFIITRAPYMVTTDRIPPRFLCNYLEFLKPFTLEIGLISSYKMPPHLLSNLVRVLSNSSLNIKKIANSPYWPTWSFHMQMSSWHHCICNEGNFACQPAWRIGKKFEYLHLNNSALLSDKKANEVASCRYW